MVDSGKPILMLIDGNSLLYRAFFAMPNFSNDEGTPTNAVYGFAMMMLRLISEDKPDGLVVAFDAPVKTFRHDEFDGYKAHRKPPPDDLKAQGPLARTMAKAFNAEVIQVEGFEADDIIGTLAKRGAAEGLHVLIVTGDMDALQLVDDEFVRVKRTVKGVTETITYDTKQVEKEFGLRPDQFPDYKALVGDSSDNIPGVPGIGPKTAAKLIQQYGTLEYLLDNLEEVEPPRTKELIRENLDLARMSKRLATIVTDMELDPGLTKCTYRGTDQVQLWGLFSKLKFASLMKKIGKPSAQTDMFSQF